MTEACLGCGAPAAVSLGSWAGLPLAWCNACNRLPERKKAFVLHEAIAERQAQERAASRPRRDVRDDAVHLRAVHAFLPRAWYRLTREQRGAVVDRLVALEGRLLYRPPADWQRLIRLTQASLRLRATVLGQQLNEREFWERDR